MRLNRLILYGIVIVLLGIIYAVIVAIQPPVRNVNIEDNGIIPHGLIRESIASITTDNVMMYDVSEATRQLLAEIPQIRKVTFKRRWFHPDLTLVIAERMPYASVVIYPDNYLVDTEGVILNQDDTFKYNSQHMDLPLIIGVSTANINENEAITNNLMGFLNQIMESVKNVIPLSGIKIDVSNTKDIRLLSKDLIEIRVGKLSDIARKSKALQAILLDNQKNINNIEYIDVKYPDVPVVKYLN